MRSGFFFSLISIFFKLECTKGVKKKEIEKMKKKVAVVGQVGEKTASREVGIFFFPNFNFF